MFDDSFSHLADNHCSSDRVVFQLVVQHPDLAAPPAAPGGTLAGSASGQLCDAAATRSSFAPPASVEH